MTTNENILRHLADQARQQPDRIALVDENSSLSFGELWHQLEELAASYQAKGVKRGDRVLILMPMSINLYRSVLAVLYAGAVAVFLDQWSSIARIREAMRLVDCQAAIFSTKFRLLGWLVPECRRIPLRLKGRVASLRKSANTSIPKIHPSQARDSALITFTTGSTGIPKAADRTHGFLDAQLKALLPLLEPKKDLVDMTLLPIVLLLNLAIGRTSIIPDIKFKKPAKFKSDQFLRKLKRHKASSITGSPYYLLELAKHLTHSKEAHQIKKITIGGAPVFPDDARLLLAGFGESPTSLPVEITIVYGSTEAEPISHLSAKQLVDSVSSATKGLAVGRVDEHAQVAIFAYRKEPWLPLDEVSFSESCLPDGTIGEILVAGDHVLTQYYKNEDAFRQNKLIVGDKIWHRTGDAGSLNKGELTLYGRCSQTISWQNQTLYPFVLTPRIKKIDGINHTAIIKTKEGPILLYEGQASAQASLENWLTEQQLAGIRIQKIDKMPLDPRHYGKVDVERLQQHYGL